MQIFVPSYYRDFTCTAGDCRHSCCVGWEIDIDGETLEKYRRTGGKMGERLRESITGAAEDAHFVLRADGRCPFLNGSGLCDIILEMGEDALCDICTDHPRYRNFFSDRVEMGLGLCCEAAAALILSRREKPEFVYLSGDGETAPTAEEAQLYAIRTLLLDMAFDGTHSYAARCAAIMERCAIRMPEKTPEAWRSFYGSLEILHPAWREMLARPIGEGAPSDAFGPQLFAYFLCRHLPGGLSDGRYRGRIAFALHAAEMILSLAGGAAGVEETARAYSEEIEYSEENTEALLTLFSAAAETE